MDDSGSRSRKSSQEIKMLPHKIDAAVKNREIQDYIIGERASMKEEDQPQMTVSLKVDQDTKMGIVTDIKEALRKAYALKINYSAQPRQ